MKKHEIAVFIENEEMLNEARELLEKYGEKEWEYKDAFSLINHANYLVYSDIDEDWFITSNPIEYVITLPQLEEILKNQ